MVCSRHKNGTIGMLQDRCPCLFYLRTIDERLFKLHAIHSHWVVYRSLATITSEIMVRGDLRERYQMPQIVLMVLPLTSVDDHLALDMLVGGHTILF